MGTKGRDIRTEEVDVNPEESEEPKEGSREAKGPDGSGPLFDLRAIRQSRGLTLQDVSSSTKISGSNLKAIEEQRFELLPEPIYARAFIDTYAGVLDIDGKEIRSLYDQYLKSLEPNEDRSEVLKKLAEEERRPEPWIWLIAACLVVLIGLFFLYQWGVDDHEAVNEAPPAVEIERSEEPENVPADVPASWEEDAAVEKSEASETGGVRSALPPAVESIKKTSTTIEAGKQPESVVEEPKEEAGAGTNATAEEKPHVLVIKASDLTWVQISRDGELPFEVMLRPGDRITKRASEKFDLIIGNAAGVEVSFQGKLLGPLGEHGEVVYLTLPSER